MFLYNKERDPQREALHLLKVDESSVYAAAAAIRGLRYVEL
jgi:hypothetical protein